MLLTTLSTGAILATRKSPLQVDAVLVAERISTDRAMLEALPVPLDASRWAGIRILDIALKGRTPWRHRPGGNGGAALRPDGQGWTVGMAVPDSGVLDLFHQANDGTTERLTFARGDDYQPTWAPDNRRLAFVTARWSMRAHYDLAILDAVTHQVRQLTSGDDTDWEPSWSPDGSRIAWIRQYADGGGRGLCVIDTDGVNLRCIPPSLAGPVALAGWGDAHRVLLRRTSGEARRLERFNFETGETDLVDTNGADAVISPDGRFALCRCPRQGYATGTWITYPLERPSEFAVLRVVGGDQRETTFDWSPTSPRPPFVANLRILAGGGAPQLGATYQLRTIGRDSSGNTVPIGVVRWFSEDTMVASIDSLGLVTPHGTGTATIRASAGGWREARLALTIGARASRVLLDEEWSRPLESAWRSFGLPKPTIVVDPVLGRAFLNNGDAAFFSGAISRQGFAIRNGLWVDATISAPLTATEWQDMVVSLVAFTDSAAWESWDHVTGDGPAGASSPSCSIRYPDGVGGKHLGEQLRVSDGLELDADAQRRRPLQRLAAGRRRHHFAALAEDAADAVEVLQRAR